ncbi:MAG: hypothetical protein IEMM0002_1059 [bacterium]|nr:MAG: hypothetical protein IEMM0002_1059 [bacterium]
MIWPDIPVMSILVLIVIANILLYIARSPAHHAIKSMSLVARNAFRLAARSVLLGEKMLRKRNRDVLLATGADATERVIEREFQRVDATVTRDLSGYPALHRSLSDLVTRIDEDYRKSTETPPPPPDWVNVVEAVAKIPVANDSMIAKILKDIHKALSEQMNTDLEEYRKSTGKRHALLTKMMPYWRKLEKTLDRVDKTIVGLHERSKAIDDSMKEYENIKAAEDKEAQKLSSSSMTQFFISGLVLLIAIGGAVINFNLIALPMSEMVGGASYIGPFKTSDVAALVIILIETTMGIYLMESLRITRLFPVIGSLDDRLRIRMIIISFGILVILACVEASLAYMRDMIAADMQALRQSLAAVEIVQPVSRWIPTLGQMVMGFILPFALTFVAIPLESFVYSSRTMFGAGLSAFLRLAAFLLRFFGNIARYTAELVTGLYDLIIFLPLWIEKNISAKQKLAETGSTGEIKT